MEGECTSWSSEAYGDDSKRAEDPAFGARWEKAVAAIGGSDLAGSSAELVEALNSIESPAATGLGLWLHGLLPSDNSRSARVVLRQYRRQLARAARPEAERAVSRNVHAYEFKRSEEEVIRATASQFRGRCQLHLRTWFRGRDGAMRCTKRGIVIAPELLSELEAAVAALRAVVNSGSCLSSQP